jgi:hypothetical protein
MFKYFVMLHIFVGIMVWLCRQSVHMVPQLFTVYVGSLVYFLSSVHMVPEYRHFHRYIVINNIKYVFIAMSIYHGFGMRVSIHIWACLLIHV